MYKLSHIYLLPLCCSVLVACTPPIKHELQTNPTAQAPDEQVTNLNQDNKKELTHSEQYTKDDGFTESLETKWQDGYLCFRLRIYPLRGDKNTLFYGKKSQVFLNALSVRNILTRLHSQIILRDSEGFQLVSISLPKIRKSVFLKDSKNQRTLYVYSTEGSQQFSKDLYQNITQFSIDWDPNDLVR